MEYCVWGEQWLPLGSSRPADLPCQVSLLSTSSLPAPKAVEAPALPEADGHIPSLLVLSGLCRGGAHPTPTGRAAGARRGWLCHPDWPTWESGGRYLGTGCILAANFCHLKAVIQRSDSYRCFPKLWVLLQTAGTGPDWKGHTQVSSPGTTMGQILLKQPSMVLVGAWTIPWKEKTQTAMAPQRHHHSCSGSPPPHPLPWLYTALALSPRTSLENRYDTDTSPLCLLLLMEKDRKSYCADFLFPSWNSEVLLKTMENTGSVINTDR